MVTTVWLKRNRTQTIWWSQLGLKVKRLSTSLAKQWWLGNMWLILCISTLKHAFSISIKSWMITLLFKRKCKPVKNRGTNLESRLALGTQSLLAFINKPILVTSTFMRTRSSSQSCSAPWSSDSFQAWWDLKLLTSVTCKSPQRSKNKKQTLLINTGSRYLKSTRLKTTAGFCRLKRLTRALTWLSLQSKTFWSSNLKSFKEMSQQKRRISSNNSKDQLSASLWCSCLIMSYSTCCHRPTKEPKLSFKGRLIDLMARETMATNLTQLLTSKWWKFRHSQTFTWQSKLLNNPNKY